MEPCAAEGRVTLTATFQGECRPVELDGHALRQALVNLIHNAIKHSPPGCRRRRWRGVCPAVATPATLRLWVEDAGQGIPPEEQERIFDRFYRCGSELRRTTQGVGLGLAIVKYIAEAHGGTVTVRSAVGQGSRFTSELPLVANPTDFDNPTP